MILSTGRSHGKVFQSLQYALKQAEEGKKVTFVCVNEAQRRQFQEAVDHPNLTFSVLAQREWLSPVFLNRLLGKEDVSIMKTGLPRIPPLPRPPFLLEQENEDNFVALVDCDDIREALEGLAIELYARDIRMDIVRVSGPILASLHEWCLAGITARYVDKVPETVLNTFHRPCDNLFATTLKLTHGDLRVEQCNAPSHLIGYRRNSPVCVIVRLIPMMEMPR